MLFCQGGRTQTRRSPMELARTALILVDAQVAFAHMVGGLEHPAIRNILRLYEAWKGKFEVERLHLVYITYRAVVDAGQITRFVPKEVITKLGEGQPTVELVPGLPQTKTEEFNARSVRKCGFDATRDTLLVRRLRMEGVTETIVCGLTTPVCVHETVNGLYHNYFDVTVVEDACASQAFPPFTAEESHQHAVARLRALWATIASTEEVLAQLAR